MQTPINPYPFSKYLSDEEQSVYHILRQAIIELYLQPGLVVNIQDICERFHTGRSPVRDALIRLEQDGLVNMLPQRGVQISLLDPKRMEQERFLRYCVEKEIMLRFVATHTPSDILHLQHEILRQEELCAGANPNPREFLMLDDQLHGYIYSAADMDFCLKAIRGVSGHYRRIRLLSCNDSLRPAEIVGQHHDLVTALQLRDSEALQAGLRRHLYKLDGELRSLRVKYASLFETDTTPQKENPLDGEDYLASLETAK